MPVKSTARIRVLCFLITTLLCLVTPAAASGASPEAEVDHFIRDQMRSFGAPGLQVAVVQRNRIVFCRGYGIANVQDRVAVDNQTLFSINSITKAFVGVAIMQLVEAGKIDLEAPISRYVDDLPAEWREVRVDQLLSNTSGLPDVYDGQREQPLAEDETDAWAKVKALPLPAKPGERFQYNQTNYVLLGRIIKKVSGKAFADFIAERQFQVAGMSRTVFGDSRDVLLHSAGRYMHEGAKDGSKQAAKPLLNRWEEFPPWFRTATGVMSTAQEMAQWIIALQDGRLLKKTSSLSTLWTPALLNDGSPSPGFGGLLNGYALGWPTVTRTQHPAVAAIGGGRAAVVVYTKDDLAIIILTNLVQTDPEQWADKIASFYLHTPIG